MVRLGDHIKLIGGGTPSKADKTLWGGEIPWMSVKDLKSDKVDSTVDYITEKGVSNSATNIVPAGSLIIATRMAVGKPVITTFKTAINQDLKAIEVDDAIDKKFLFYFLKNKQKHFESIATGATVKGIKIKAITDLKIPLPPLETQRKIAAILDTADKYRQKTKALIDKYDELAQSLFLDMFGDPVLNTKNWDVKKLGDLGKLDRGKSKHRPRNAPELLGGPYPLIQTGDVANSSGYITGYKSTYSEIGLAQSRMWPSGTLCITIAANIAKTGILTFDACFPDSVVGFIPNQFTKNEFVQSWMSFLQKIIEENAPESAQKNINLKILRNLDVICPPIELQNEFSSRIELIQEQRESVITGLSQSEELFNSLLQKAFKGELA